MRQHDQSRLWLGSGAALLALAALVAGPQANANPASGPVVETPLGFVQGAASPTVGSAVEAFLGLRYADSPTGSLRWAPPQFTGAYGSKKSPTAAVTPPTACPQTPGEFSDANPMVTQGNGSENEPVKLGLPGTEDCLFLNVWRPASTHERSKLPVLIWIHGGALTTGASAGYDPSVMVRDNGIIVVTINYRLAAFGWLAESALAADAPNHFQNIGDTGDYGLMDQQFAMAWVRDNIASFGGDPAKVTISGESAGGLSVSLNLASPNTGAGLFRGAIIESGGYMTNDVAPLASSEAAGAGFVSKVLESNNNGVPQSLSGNIACNNLTATQIAALTPAQVAACLRLQSIETVLQNQSGGEPTSGTRIVPLGLKQAFSSGAFNRVPVLQGTNHDEGRLFVPAEFDAAFGGTPNPTVFVPGGPAQALINSHAQTFEQELAGVVGAALATELTSTPLPKTVTAPYSPAAFPNPDFRNQPSADEALSAAFTDEVFSCNGLESNTFLKDFVQVFAYEFHDPNAPNLFQPLIGFSFGSSHASELQYLFDPTTLQGPFDAAANQSVVVPPGDGPTNAVQPPPLTEGGTLLARQMKAYWANFVKTTTPNSFGLPLWRPFNISGEVRQLTPALLSFPLDAASFSDEHNCGFWGPILNPPAL
jgi:para-nitrobenzyl esterase